MDTEFMRAIACSLVWTSRARTRELSPPCSPLSRLLSRASRAFTFHNIPQMESLLAGYFLGDGLILNLSCTEKNDTLEFAKYTIT